MKIKWDISTFPYGVLFLRDLSGGECNEVMAFYAPVKTRPISEGSVLVSGDNQLPVELVPKWQKLAH